MADAASPPDSPMHKLMQNHRYSQLVDHIFESLRIYHEKPNPQLACDILLRIKRSKPFVASLGFSLDAIVEVENQLLVELKEMQVPNVEEQYAHLEELKGIAATAYEQLGDEPKKEQLYHVLSLTMVAAKQEAIWGIPDSGLNLILMQIQMELDMDEISNDDETETFHDICATHPTFVFSPDAQPFHPQTIIDV